MLKKFIRKIILEILSEECVKPKTEKLQEYIFAKKVNLNPFDAILKMDVTEIRLTINYVSLDGNGKHNANLSFDDAASFYTALVNHVPVYDYFNSMHIVVKYKHSMGAQEAIDIIVNSYDNKIYHKDEFAKIFTPMIMWFKERPELII